MSKNITRRETMGLLGLATFGLAGCLLYTSDAADEL